MDSQCLIMPDGEPFVYDFNVADQVGSNLFRLITGKIRHYLFNRM